MVEKKFRSHQKEKFSYANKLLERVPEADYIQTWTQLVMQEKRDGVPEKKEGNLVVFRLLNEWFALPTYLFSEVTELKKIHKIPHKDSRLLLGAVNMKGCLRLVFNLHEALEVGQFHYDDLESSEKRLVAVQKEGEDWIFPVDEISKIVTYDPHAVENVPVTVSKSFANYLKGVITFDNRRLGLLDDALLFADLKRSLA